MNTLPATLFDGRSSRPRPVQLSLAVGGDLQIATDDGVLRYPTSQLQLAPRLARLPRTLRLPDGGHLELADDPLLDRWFAQPSAIESLAHRLERHWPSAAAAGVLLVIGVVLFFWQGLPRAADSVARQIPVAVEHAIAEEVMRLVDRTMLDPSALPEADQARLREAFAALTEGLPRAADYSLEFRAGRAFGPNAFALPGGRVVVTDQLVELMEDDTLVVAVLAHEAGHHEQRHGMRAALQSSAVVVLVSFFTGDVTGFGSLAVSIPTLLVESGYSRDFEREADTFAVDLLKRKQLPSDSFAAALRKLQSAMPSGDDEDKVSGYLATHPATAERIEAASRAAQ